MKAHSVGRNGAILRNGLRWRIKQFFDDNPDEQLTHADALVKFGGGKKTLNEAISRLKSVGVVETIHVIRAKR